MIKGVVVTAYGIDASGARCESWAADKLAFSITAPLTAGAAKLIRDQIAAAGAAQVTVASCHGMISGNLSSKAQRRITGKVDDTAVAVLATLQFRLPDADIASAAGAVKAAQKEYLEHRKTTPRPLKYERTCKVCSAPFTSASPASAHCSDRCRKITARAVYLASVERRKQRAIQEEHG
jgi:predicted nucleic acid-binding Zn ribbon protein